MQVRSAQSLTLLSEALKLSLLLSKTPDPALNDEAVALIQSTEAEKLKCALLLADIMGLDVGRAQDLVQDMDRSFTQSQTTQLQPKAEGDAGGEEEAAKEPEVAAEGVEDEMEEDDMEDVPSG